MEIEKMNEQQIIEYLRSNSTSSKALGDAKSRTVEDFFVGHNITIRCPKCSSPKKVKNGTNDSGITRYKCKDCGKGCSIVTNTIFEGNSYSADEVINAVHAVLNGDTTALNAVSSVLSSSMSSVPQTNTDAIERYGSVEDMKNAFNKLPEKTKRGRPKKAS